jgi:hypothetical protein
MRPRVRSPLNCLDTVKGLARMGRWVTARRGP